MTKSRIALFVAFSCLIIVFTLFYYFDVINYFKLANLKHHAAFLSSYSRQNYLFSSFLYCLLFVVAIAASLPITGPFTLLGGFLFGVARGSLYATCGATLGATIAFLVLRRGVTEMVRGKYARKLAVFNKKLQQYGVSYLLLMHFSTVVPYAIINVLAALTKIPTFTIAWTTAVGFVPSALVYTFAGSKLTTITSMQDIFSAEVLVAFALLMALTIVPLVVKRFSRELEV